jgi:hypothetical protein
MVDDNPGIVRAKSQQRADGCERCFDSVDKAKKTRACEVDNAKQTIHSVLGNEVVALRPCGRRMNTKIGRKSRLRGEADARINRIVRGVPNFLRGKSADKNRTSQEIERDIQSFANEPGRMPEREESKKGTRSERESCRRSPS